MQGQPHNKRRIGYLVLALVLIMAGVYSYLINRQPAPLTKLQVKRPTPLAQPKEPLAQEQNTMKIGNHSIASSEDGVEESSKTIDDESEKIAFDKNTKRWMTSVGIPMPEDDAKLFLLSEDELEERVRSGNLAAIEILSFKKIKRGAIHDGINTLEDGVVEGSIGAALYLARLYSNDSEGVDQDNVVSCAWYRVARHMGEAGSGLMGKGLGYGWESEELILAELYFMTLLRELNEKSQMLRGTNLVFNPQPIFISN